MKVYILRVQNIMNILASIQPDTLRNVFGWDPETVSAKVSQLASQIDISKFNDQVSTNSESYEKMFNDISKYLLSQLSRILRSQIRMLTPRQAANVYVLDPGIFYVVNNQLGNGANGQIFKVRYKATRQSRVIDGILKIMPSRGDTKMLYELVTQTYMHEALLAYSYMSAPKLICVRQQRGQYVHAIMEEVTAPFFIQLDENNILVAIAHLMKCLYRLQSRYHFMHRDLHNQNVAFDADRRHIHLIDFGYSCINPPLDDLAWQMNSPFYPIMLDSHASRCDNPSLDVCCIVGSSSHKHPFLNAVHNEMIEAASEKLNGDVNKQKRAVRVLSEPASNLYTLANEKKGWKVGNKLRETDLRHWWVYDMSEVPLPQFYPEHMLTRLLEQIDLQEWPYIRDSFARVFDVIAPKCRVSYQGQAGTIQQCLDDGNFRVTFDAGGEAELDASQLKRITTKANKK